MCESTKITVIIPVYNGENTLDRCLQSVVNQTYKSLEIIVIDDGSEDDTKNICKRWMDKDNRIALYHKELDHVSKARNLGLEKATGDFLSWVDADDYLELDMYSTMMKQFEANDEIDVVICNTVVHYPNEETRCVENLDSAIIDGQEMIRRILINGESGSALWNKLFRMSLVRRVDAKFKQISGKYSEDALWLTAILAKANKVKRLDKGLYHYIISNTSTSRGGKVTEETCLRWVDGSDIFIREFESMKFRNSVRNDIIFKIKKYIYFLQYMAYMNNYEMAFKKLTELLMSSRLDCPQSDFNKVIFIMEKVKMPRAVVQLFHKLFLTLHLLESA